MNSRGELRYSIDVTVNQKLTETQKSRLILALSGAVKSALGEPYSGTIMVYSERE